jgi:hypothetical protein
MKSLLHIKTYAFSYNQASIDFSAASESTSRFQSLKDFRPLLQREQGILRFLLIGLLRWLPT